LTGRAFQWLGTDSVEFHIGHGDMIRLLRRCGFEVEDLIELRPRRARPPSTRWPAWNGPGNGPEEVWKARRTH
jgi:hypothetical protein